MFSYSGEGPPLNISSSSSIEKIAQEANMGHYMTSNPLGNINMVYHNLHSQNHPFVHQDVIKDVPGVSKDICNQLYPGNLSKNHYEVPVKYHREAIPNIFETATMERTRQLLNIPQLSYESQLVSYQNCIDYKWNTSPAVDQKPTPTFHNKIKSDIPEKDIKLNPVEESKILLHQTKQELSLQHQSLDEEPSEKNQYEDIKSEKIHQSGKHTCQPSVIKKFKVTKDVCTTKTSVSKASTETGFFNTFSEDPHGVTREHNDLKLYQVIESVAEIRSDTGSSKQDIYHCPTCSLYFIHPKRFKLHTKWHTFGKTNEKRRLASEEREQKKKAKKKPLQKDEGQKFICNVCGRGLASSRKLLGHKMRVHKDLPKVCRICNTTYQTSEQHQEHMRSAHTNTDGKPQRYACDYCDKTFCTYHTMIRHQGAHLEKKFPCDQCEKRFGSMQKLNVHVKSHARAVIGKTLHCSYCAKGFYDDYSLQAHERVHRGELVFKCDMCGSGYATNASLKRHVKLSHSGAKPFECSVCRRCFVSQKILQRHALRAHAPGGPKRVRKKRQTDDE